MNWIPHLLAVAFASSALAQSTLENDIYTLTSNIDHSVTVDVTGVPSQTLLPEFTVMYSATNPVLDQDHNNYILTPRTSALWTGYEESASALNTYLNSTAVQADLLFPVNVTGSGTSRVWTWYKDSSLTDVKLTFTGRYAAGTTNPFLVGTKYALTADNATISGDTLHWTFVDDPGRPFTLTADLELAPGSADPQIRIHLNVRTAGYFSTAFTGSPTIAVSHAIELEQETATVGGRLVNHVVPEDVLHLPFVCVENIDGWSHALIADPAFSLFLDPTSGLPRVPYKITNTYFGAMLQKDYVADTLKPVIMGPLMGGTGSLMAASATYDFGVRYLLRAGDWKALYREVAQGAYANVDLRDNTGTGSMNRTLERVMDYLGNANGRNFAMWNDEQKYYDYFNDSAGSFKPFSPLFGLSAAIITDDENFYRTRARPQVEYALSRPTNLFSPYSTEDSPVISSVNTGLGGSYLSSAHLVSLYHFLNDNAPAALQLADAKGYSTSSFPLVLAKYSVTNDPSDLAAALSDATSDYNADPSGARDDYSDWLDIWEASGSTPATRDPNYLSAAVESIYRELATTITLSPPVPNEDVLMDIGNKAPIHVQASGRHVKWGFPRPVPYPTPERYVPAWRAALNGLQGLGTYRGEFWMNNHGHIMRIAGITDDIFLRDVARWGMVGRFASYPGDNRWLPSLVIERPDAPEHPIWQLTYTTFNPGHAWELAGEIIDFLVSDIFYRSVGAIDFPSRTMHGVSFRVRAYGDRPGVFYGDSGVRLWMPKGLALPDSPQIDYIAGYGESNGKLYLAFANQSASAQNVTVALDPNRVDCQASHSANWWSGNTDMGATTVSDNQLTFTIAAKDIVAYAIDSVSTTRMLQAKMLDPSAPALDSNSVQSASLSLGSYPAATVNGMLLSLGRGLTHAYVYSTAQTPDTQYAYLEYRQGSGSWLEATDMIFPYEFSIDYMEGAGDFQYIYHVVTADGTDYATAATTLATESTLPAQAPQAPSDLAVTVGDGQLALRWTPSTGATSYKVKRAPTSGGTYSTIASGLTDTAYLNTGLTNGTTYYYAVSAVNATGESANSGHTHAAPQTTPGGLTVTATGHGTVSLSWTPAAGAVSYVIKRTDVGGGPYDGPFVTVASGLSGTTFIDTGLDDGITYRYEVAAVTATGESAGSAPVAAIPSVTTIIIDNEDPSGVTVTGTWSLTNTSAAYNGKFLYGSGSAGRSVLFTPSIPTAGTYNVYAWWAASTSRATNAPFDIVHDGGTSTVTVDMKTDSAKWNQLGTYVFAAGTDGSVKLYSPANGTLAADAVKLVAAAPVAPDDLTAIAGENGIALTWTAVAGASGYVVRRATVADGDYAVIACPSSAGYTDSSLPDGAAYFYTVTAVGPGGESEEPAPVTATTYSRLILISEPSLDGFVVESGTNTGVGGTANSTLYTSTGIRAGDFGNARQYLGFLSFDTSPLPTGVVVVQATLRLRRGNLVGDNPFDTLGTCCVDIAGSDGFSGSTALESSDFQAAAAAASIASLSNALANGDWSTATFDATGRSLINPAGHTQLRLRFSTHDNGNGVTDYIGWYPPETSNPTNRPELEILYQ